MTTPTLNVNLKRCTCGHHVGHGDHCWGKPILLPCHIPRTVEMMVRLGECTALCSTRMRDAAGQIRHKDDCPARPIRFTCTIGGDGTWAGSGVSKVDPHHEALGRFAIINDAYALAYAACRKRWAIVKALVTGHTDLLSLITGPAAIDLMAQRDAVFAALAKMATLEHEHEAARLTLPASCRPIPATGSDTPHPSADALRLYVSHLIAKVSAL